MSVNSYKKIDISTDIANATPLKIIKLLYEGAIKKTAIARGAIERKDYLAKSEAVSGLIAILMELERSLDPKHNESLVIRLSSLYRYMRELAFDANINNDVEKLAEVSKLLSTVKEGWDGIEDPASK